jgi:hypothetical protein
MSTRRRVDVLEQAFDTDWVRRCDLGYKRLYSRCWDAHNHGDLPALLDLFPDRP